MQNKSMLLTLHYWLKREFSWLNIHQATYFNEQTVIQSVYLEFKSHQLRIAEEIAFPLRE